MVLGAGVDLVEFRRFEQLEDPDGFFRQILTANEYREACKHPRKQRFAARAFAIKEAILKALGCGLHSGSSWRDIDLSEGPVPMLHNTLRDLAGGMSVSAVYVSYSCSKNHGVAFVILEGSLKENP